MQYSVKTYNNPNSNLININDINTGINTGISTGIININDELNKGNEFEYEKTEKIKIRKINPNNNNNNNNNVEEKRIILQKIKNNNYQNGNMSTLSPMNLINAYKYKYNNNMNDTSYMDREMNLNRQKRTNNLSYSKNEMKYHKYPFVIKTNNNENQNGVYYRGVNNPYKQNYKSTYKINKNNMYMSSPYENNNTMPDYEKSMTENSEYVITPMKDNHNQYVFQKKRMNDNYDNNNYDPQQNNIKITRNNLIRYNDSNIDESVNNKDDDEQKIWIIILIML